MKKPSHVTVPQAARILQISRQAVENRLERKTLTSIDFAGSKMINLKTLQKKGKDNEKD